MKCSRCQSDKVVLTEEAGYFEKDKIYNLIFCTVLFLLGGVGYLLYKVVYFNIGVRIVCLIVGLFGLIFLITLAIHNANVREKQWHKTSRSKFTCMECGHQWYVNKWYQEKEMELEKDEKIVEPKKSGEKSGEKTELPLKDEEESDEEIL